MFEPRSLKDLIFLMDSEYVFECLQSNLKILYCVSNLKGELALTRFKSIEEKFDYYCLSTYQEILKEKRVQ